MMSELLFSIEDFSEQPYFVFKVSNGLLIIGPKGKQIKTPWPGKYSIEEVKDWIAKAIKNGVWDESA